jgi:hypothetical protein
MHNVYPQVAHPTVFSTVLQFAVPIALVLVVLAVIAVKLADGKLNRVLRQQVETDYGIKLNHRQGRRLVEAVDTGVSVKVDAHRALRFNADASQMELVSS